METHLAARRINIQNALVAAIEANAIYPPIPPCHVQKNANKPIFDGRN